ncbi:hypothetical protein GCM10023319_12230 [Nocardia iowensis]
MRGGRPRHPSRSALRPTRSPTRKSRHPLDVCHSRVPFGAGGVAEGDMTVGLLDVWCGDVPFGLWVGLVLYSDGVAGVVEGGEDVVAVVGAAGFEGEGDFYLVQG